MANLKKSKMIINVGVDVGKHTLGICIQEKQLFHYQVVRLVMKVTVLRSD
ncbi:MAG: hypothetical protein OEY06_05360 [Gammaproteobacteria bacterium]|nr:hypothetical protein [Gammaproteobacteria bacterium]